MTTDPTRHARAGGLRAVGSGRYATSIGPLAVSVRGDVWRVKLGESTLPDYGFVDTTGFAPPPDDAALTIGADPVTLALRDALGPPTDEHFRGWTRLPALGRGEDGFWSAAFALPTGSPVYGLGEVFGPLDKRGQLVRSHVDDALGVNTALTYKPCPFAWGFSESGACWGVLVNTPCDVWTGAGYPPWSHRTLAFACDDAALDLFLFSAPDPAALLRAYHQLTGAPAAPPLWSFGVWLSKAYYRTADEILDAARTVRAKAMPCDVITFDGRAWQDTPTRFHFHFDPSRYPDPKPVLDALKAQGFRICAWEYPPVARDGALFPELAAQNFLLKDAAGAPLVFDWDKTPGSSPFGKVLTPLPPSGLPDFTNPDAFADWRDSHAPLFALGVDVVKSDFGEQVPDDARAHNGDDGRRLHNAYPALYNRCVFEATQKFTREAPMVWGRAGWIGAQTVPIQWGGDPQSDWEGLAASIRGGLSHGMTGVPCHATDIGGFYGAAQPDAELFLRWLGAAVFASHLRFHGIGPREPWSFGEAAEAIARRWLELRMRLVPYLHATARDAAATGLPVMRAMALAFPEDRVARGFETQFMCGEVLLVAPVIHAGGRAELWLPEGGWHDFWTGERHEGRRLLRMSDVPLDRLPVFGREGAKLPLGRVVQHTGEINAADPIEDVRIFA
jgi:alpha-D-xyloside xylohydrolase